jgi:hypothetical protein
MSFAPAAIRAARQARIARAVERALELAPVLRELQESGITSLNGIAAALNERGVPTPAGHPHWHASQVARVVRRLTRLGRRQPAAP